MKSESLDPDSVCITKTYFYALLAGVALIYAIVKYLLKRQDNRKYELFLNTPKDTVIIHCFPRVAFPSNIPTPQPWVQKIELYCKLAKIPYVIETEYVCGPVGGKFPWISLNGHHMGDSQLILEYLQKKFEVGKDVFGNYSDEELAIARAVRVMLEDRFFWAMPFWRFIWPDGKALFMRDWSCLNFPFFYPLWYFRWNFGRIFKAQTMGHGIGRHSKEDILNMLKGDLRTVSRILGNKKFILGDKLCIEDCAIFGFAAQVSYGMPESPYDKLVTDELPNLREYSRRIKEEYFPEWQF